MLAARLRLSAAAAVLTLGGALLAAAPAHAAGATLKLDPSDVAFVDEPLRAFGTCTAGSRTAVVTVTQGDTVVAEEADTLDSDLAYSVSLDLAKGEMGLASVRVECFKYADAAPLGSDEAEIFIVTDLDLAEVEVSVTPSTVAIGSRFTISGTCPVGTTSALVLAGSGENDEPFLEEEVTPAPDGSVSLTTTLTAGRLVSVGDAGAAVLCGDEDQPLALGFAEFTITKAAAASAVPASPAAPTRPVLANTGSDNGPLAALGVGLLLLGLGAHRLRQIRAGA